VGLHCQDTRPVLRFEITHDIHNTLPPLFVFACDHVPIATKQKKYNLSDRKSCCHPIVAGIASYGHVICHNHTPIHRIDYAPSYLALAFFSTTQIGGTAGGMLHVSGYQL